jgi:hypothetical protein
MNRRAHLVVQTRRARERELRMSHRGNEWFEGVR